MEATRINLSQFDLDDDGSVCEDLIHIIGALIVHLFDLCNLQLAEPLLPLTQEATSSSPSQVPSLDHQQKMVLYNLIEIHL